MLKFLNCLYVFCHFIIIFYFNNKNYIFITTQFDHGSTTSPTIESKSVTFLFNDWFDSKNIIQIFCTNVFWDQHQESGV